MLPLVLRASLFTGFTLNAFAFLVAPAQATVIQILHTNDLHAALSTAGAPKPGDDEYGGWAQIKAKMDELTAAARSQGIETLRLDAGDFTECTMDYFPDQEVNILRAFQHMGYDAAALGNHDWMMGARSLDAAYGRAPFPFPILSANLKLRSNLTHLRRQVVPSTQVTKAGVRIGIVGLSTDEALYKWIGAVSSRKNEFRLNAFDDNTYEDQDDDGNPVQVTELGIANASIRDLRQSNDLVIALTHIGIGADRVLAANSEGLDLIVGGHSHTVLESLDLVNDKSGREVPIVQTGVNGKYIGKLLVEV